MDKVIERRVGGDLDREGVTLSSPLEGWREIDVQSPVDWCDEGWRVGPWAAARG